MAKRGRPKVSWEHLKDRGAKPSVWKRRRLETEPPAPVATALEPPEPQVNPEDIAAYVASVARENETFAARCAPGEVLSREYGSGYDWRDANPTYQKHGAIFGWNPCLLTECRNFAKQVTGDPKMAGTWAHELSTRFLADLTTSEHGCVFDVEAAKNVERMIKTWSDPEKPVPLLCALSMVEFMCWKRRDTGEFRFEDELLLGFYPDDIRIMDLAFAAQQQAAQP